MFWPTSLTIRREPRAWCVDSPLVLPRGSSLASSCWLASHGRRSGRQRKTWRTGSSAERGHWRVRPLAAAPPGVAQPPDQQASRIRATCRHRAPAHQRELQASRIWTRRRRATKVLGCSGSSSAPAESSQRLCPSGASGAVECASRLGCFRTLVALPSRLLGRADRRLHGLVGLQPTEQVRPGRARADRLRGHARRRQEAACRAAE